MAASVDILIWINLTGYSNWKHERRIVKSFHKHESWNFRQQAIEGLIEIPKSTEEVSEMLKIKFTEVPSKI